MKLLARPSSLAMALAGLTFASAPPGRAATATPAGPSFECARAASALEKTICADPALSAADRKAAASYRNAVAKAPADWRPALLESQRSWLGYVARICLPGDLARLERPTKAACLCDAFQERARTLDATLSRIGGVGFVQLTSYATHPPKKADLDPGQGPRSVTIESTLLQIASPASPAQRQWNAMIASRLRKAIDPDPYVAEEAVVAIQAISPDFIQALINVAYERGPGGESHELTAVNWSLKLGRPLGLGDLFADPRTALKALGPLAMKALRKDAGDEPIEVSAADVARIVREPRYWSITREGLDLLVGDEFGRGNQLERLGAPIPWSDLKPYLRKDLPFDPAALRGP